MQKITPCLWFDDNAEEAIAFYCSLFKNSKIVSESRYPEGAPGPAGQVMSATFELEGQKFMALNGGPMFKFNEAVSFYVDCEDQGEVDHFWNKILENGGTESQCGWIKDKFGLFWQIVPKSLGEMMAAGGRKAENAMHAMLKMKKLDVAALKEAYDKG